VLYSPRIDQHTRQLYRLGQLLGKPMTVVADDLLKHGLAHIEEVYGQELATRWQEVKAVAEDPPPRLRR
jgi:Fe2+ transport system protein FeoA